MDVLELPNILTLSRVNGLLMILMSIEDGSRLVFASKPETAATRLRRWIFSNPSGIIATARLQRYVTRIRYRYRPLLTATEENEDCRLCCGVDGGGFIREAWARRIV